MSQRRTYYRQGGICLADRHTRALTMKKLPNEETSVNIGGDIATDGAPIPAVSGAGASESGEQKMNAHSGAAGHATKKQHKARIEHKVPGRLRVKIPSGKDNAALLKVFETVFSAIPGITKVKSKTETGSIVIHYDLRREAEFQSHFNQCCAQHAVSVSSARPGDEIEELAKKFEAEAEFLAEHSELVRATVELFKNVDYQIKAATGNMIDLKIVLVGGLAVATFVEIGAEAATPMWVTLALFAVNHFIEMRHDPVPATPSARMRVAAG